MKRCYQSQKLFSQGLAVNSSLPLQDRRNLLLECLLLGKKVFALIMGGSISDLSLIS